MASGSSVGGRVRSAADEVETELKRLISYINDEVVPQVRRNSSTALRGAAEQLTRLAETLDLASGGSPKR